MKSLLSILILILSCYSFAQSSREIIVSVDISSQIFPANAQDWTVYIYAAKPDSRLPLAALKTTFAKLPIDVVLKQSMFLLPNHTLNDANELVVSVTVSKDSDPHKHSAQDLIGQSAVLKFEQTDKLVTRVTVDRLDIRN